MLQAKGEPEQELEIPGADVATLHEAFFRLLKAMGRQVGKENLPEVSFQGYRRNETDVTFRRDSPFVPPRSGNYQPQA